MKLKTNPKTVLRSILGTERARSLLPAVRLLTAVRDSIAVLYRRFALHHVVFIGVTGSCGKTTTKELIAAVLSSRWNGNRSPGTRNLPQWIASEVLRIKPWHKFYVQELAAAVRGVKIPLETSLRIVRPEIGVVTNVGADHISVFHSIEAIAAEKGKLVAALPRHGIAVLNSDDPNVRAMKARCAGRVISYGMAPDAMVRAENIRCRWPERLSFTVIHDERTYPIQTQLLGTHWVSCVLAALAVGIAMRVPLPAAIQAISGVPPFRRRMCSIERPDGVTFIQDDVKAPLWSIPPVLDFMRDAQARRKVIVIGTISDYQGNSDRHYVAVARQALASADHVVFVGSRASKCLKARRSAEDDALQAFYSVAAAREHLTTLFEPGDLVLLKGVTADHLETLMTAPLATDPSREAKNESPLPATQWHRPIRSPVAPQIRAVMGLGNPGEQYRNTPHNIGQRVVDLLADQLGAQWLRQEHAMVARVGGHVTTAFLIKPLTHVNATGPTVLRLSQQLGFDIADLLLIHDDLDLPLGAVRVRATGSDGGHKGVRSILEAFQTDQLQRVKIGVKRSEETDKHSDKNQRAGYVVRPFAATDLPLMERACAEAAGKILELLQR
jgi:aminoacyl-tRNA hydrolase